MVMSIYKEVLTKLEKRPWKLLGISLLAALLIFTGYSLFCAVPIGGMAVEWLVGVAMIMIFLRGFEEKEINVDQLFDCFRDWDTAKRVMLGMGWQTLWIFIWSLIPIVGPVFGIIRMYEYRLVPYILMKEPEIGIKESTKVSKERTMGYKGKMFLAEILWIAIAFIIILILGIFSAVRYIGWIFGIINFIFIVAVCVFGYLFLGYIRSAFYLHIEKRRVGSEYYEEPVAEQKTSVENNQSEEMKTCHSCGASMNAGDIFCSSCGSKYSEASEGNIKAADELKTEAVTVAADVNENVSYAADKEALEVSETSEIVEKTAEDTDKLTETGEHKTEEVSAEIEHITDSVNETKTDSEADE